MKYSNFNFLRLLNQPIANKIHDTKAAIVDKINIALTVEESTKKNDLKSQVTNVTARVMKIPKHMPITYPKHKTL